MSLETTVNDYWRRSRHMENLKNKDDKEKFALNVLVPDRDTTADLKRRELLTRLIHRALAA